MRYLPAAMLLIMGLILSAADDARADRPNILFCIADDWGWPHAGAYGDPVVKTPTFDRLAREGVLFEHAYVASPSCTPSRNAILTGQWHWRLGPGVNLWSWLDKKHPVYPLLLQEAGYHVGYWRKSWGPGKLEMGGYEKDEHPAGTHYRKGFEEFLGERPEGKPFAFWLGSSDPHRPYKLGSGKESGMDLSRIHVPKFYPDAEMIRSDIADYYFEVQRFDSDVAEAIRVLEEAGELENTIIVMTGDHGMPFPRCKSNIYEWGVHVPLAIRWGAKVKGGQRTSEFVSFVDLAPTFLEAAGVEAPDVMTGRSLMPLLLPGGAAQDRSHMIYGMERHTAGRPGSVGYPCRGIRTHKWAYIRNFKPDRWPAGDPEQFTDVDPGTSWGKQLTKTYLLVNRDKPDVKRYYEMSFAKRPAEELYDMTADPYQLNNLADDPEYAEVKAELWSTLEAELKATEDPRIFGKGDAFEEYPYFGRGRYNPDFKPDPK